MSDQNFREIQLSVKHLVFLFMCLVVVTVVVFLFGVSVGRGVGPASAQTTQAAVPEGGSQNSTASAAAPAVVPAQPAANELSYADALEGRGAGDPSKTPPPVPAEEPTAQPPSAAAGSGASSAAAAPPAESPAPSPAANGWVVQVGAFNSNDVATKEVSKLQGKGYPAFVFTEPETTPGPRYKVRVGPYSARAEADRMLKTLTTEGYKPLLKR